jgi:hypothetical protein
MLNSKTYSFIEDVNGTTTPKAVCINADGYVQTADANVTNLDKFIGFVNTNVAPGVVSPFVNNSSGTSSTVSFTPGAGTNKVLIVSIGLYRNLSNIVLPSGVTFNGVAMTLVDTLNPDSTPGDTWGQAIYALAIGSSTTTANVVVSGASYDNIVVQAACYSGVDQTTPVLIKGKATGTSATPSVTIDPTSGYCRVVNTIINNTSRTVSSWNDGQTQRDSDDIAFGSYYISISDTTNTNGASNAYDATLSGSATWGIQAFELKPSTPTVTGSVLFQGSLSGFSGLTPNAKYYLSNTAGEISTTPGSTSVLLAKALSATEIVIIQN